MAVNFRRSDVVNRRIRRAVMRGVAKTCEDIKDEAVNLIQEGPATGRIYRRRGVTHQASAPGEPPMSDLGNLAGSIDIELNPEEISGVVKATAEYAAALEFGTMKMEARPFMRPAYFLHIDDLERNVMRELRRIL